ncbi:MAG: MAPEG family protein [Casimicrobiaceae bacterium]
MSEQEILFPVLALAALTFAIAIVMSRRRFREMRERRIRPQEVASAAAMSTTLKDTGPADNFRNLFELPVLFYTAILTIYSAKLAAPIYITLAWLFVGSRLVHSVIHCTSNRVRYRFYAYLVGFFTLVAMWVLLAWDLLARSA